MDVPYFESVLHAKICVKFRCGHLTFKVLVLDFSHAFQSVFSRTHAKTWADKGALKAKYPVNAVNFKRDL